MDFQQSFKELRGNHLIDYKPLGMVYKLYACEVCVDGFIIFLQICTPVDLLVRYDFERKTVGERKARMVTANSSKLYMKCVIRTGLKRYSFVQKNIYSQL